LAKFAKGLIASTLLTKREANPGVVFTTVVISKLLK
jgi:hypothetical protein